MLFIKGTRKAAVPAKFTVQCGICGLFSEIAPDTAIRIANFII